MNSKTKNVVALGLAAAYACTLVSGVQLFKSGTASADENVVTQASTYYYDSLTYTDSNGEEQEFVLAKKFYKAIDDMNKSGDFKDGEVEYSLTEILSSDEIKKWVIDGELTIPKAFSAARDAYYTEHPELFYIDFYKMTISAARNNGVYSAYIDSGREANLYHDTGFKSANDVELAIAAYNNKVNEIANAAKAAADADEYGTAKDVLQARYVNNWLADNENVVYDYGAYDDFVQTGTTTAAMSNTAYGALNLNKAVCSGFARAYKSVMDRLGIPCVVVTGYSASRIQKEGGINEGTIAHAWNYIYLENPDDGIAAQAEGDNGAWYAVDTTWNNTGSNKLKYFNLGANSINKDHVLNGIISSSQYELKFPELSEYDYGCTNKSQGLSLSAEYVPASSGEKDKYGNPLMSTYEYISYNGKDVMKLKEEDGLHIIRRYGVYKDGKLLWQSWVDLYELQTAFGEFSGMEHKGNVTKSSNNTLGLYTQYAVTAVEPNSKIDPVIAPNQEAASAWYYVFENEPDDFITVISEVFENKTYGTYVPAPYVSKTNHTVGEDIRISDNMRAPDGSSMMDEKYAEVYEITYDEPLKVIDDSQDIGISFVTRAANAYNYAKLLPLENGKLVELVGENTLRFKFMPSLMYEHNMDGYTFTFTNVGSNKTQTNADGTSYVSEKAPNPVTFFYSRSYLQCPNVFGDGRLWVDCCAQPTLISNNDLSEVDFIDPDTGKYFSESQRSQMMLVVDSPNETEQATMENLLDGNSDINVNKNEVLKSETYEISLQICGKYPKIPNGSYVKIALGFPEGYGPDDEGVTFKLYHYKRNNKNQIVEVEEIPCVVTRFGIVATVESFSPFMVAVVPAEKASSEKLVYASVDGKGGKLNNADGQVQKVAEGGSYTYTIQPEEGYQVHKVTLNGVDVTDKVADGKLTVNYADMSASNEVEIQFISDAALARYAEKNIVDPVKVIVPVGGVTIDGSIGADIAPNTGDNSKTIGLIVGISIIVVVAAVSVGAVIFVKKRKSK